MRIVRYHARFETRVRRGHRGRADVSARRALELELESAIADDPQRAYAQRAPDELWDKAAAAESRQYLVETFCIPNPQRVDLEEHVLAGVA